MSCKLRGEWKLETYCAATEHTRTYSYTWVSGSLRSKFIAIKIKKLLTTLTQQFLSKEITFIHLFIWPCCMVCGILVPWPGIKPRALAVDVQHPNHWTTRELPRKLSLRVPTQTSKSSCTRMLILVLLQEKSKWPSREYYDMQNAM